MENFLIKISNISWKQIISGDTFLVKLCFSVTVLILFFYSFIYLDKYGVPNIVLGRHYLPKLKLPNSKYTQMALGPASP
mgnify:CR=1 FL=1